MSEQRKRFERWISSPPYEQPTKRFPKDPQAAGWPGQYREIDVQLAWEAFQEGAKSPTPKEQR